MLNTPGLKYLVRRLDGTPHPTHANAPAVAWTSAGYIEFMESAFKQQGLDYIHRLILHEKAHFLWDYLFDDKLKQDWGDRVVGIRTLTMLTVGQQHSKPNLCLLTHMLRIPTRIWQRVLVFTLCNPTSSVRAHQFEFIENRVMHGTRYISQIREDLTFQVYNLYPDYVYPGKIKRVEITVEGELLIEPVWN